MTSILTRMKSKITKNDKGLREDKDNQNKYISSLSNAKEDNTGILIVTLIKTKHDKGLGLTVSGGIDRGSVHPVVSHLRLGGIADRSESLVIGDIILAVNNKSTENLTHQEIVDLLRSAGQHVNLKILYKIPVPEIDIHSSCKTAIITLKKERDGFGVVARESPKTSIHGYRPVVVVSLRPGSAVQRDGLLHVGDRLLAINDQALLGLSHEDVVLLLKHAHDQVSLQIEYDVGQKNVLNTRNGTWIVEIEKPAPTVSVGLTLAEERRGVFVISHVIEGGLADRLGVFHKDDQIIRVNGTFVKDLSLAAVVELLAKTVSRMKIEFLTSHTLNKEDDEPALSDRYANVDSWTGSADESRDYSDDQRSESTARDEAPVQHRTLPKDDARERLLRALPQTPSGNFVRYDNATRVLLNDSDNYAEISDVVRKSRQNYEVESEPESNRRMKGQSSEVLYSKVRKRRSNSLGINTSSRTSPLSGHMDLLSGKSSLSNIHSGSLLRGRRPGLHRSNGSFTCMKHAQLCRMEYVEVNLTADSQGFGLIFSEGFMAQEGNILMIGHIDDGGPAERSGILQVNDQVFGINDTDVTAMTADHANSVLQSFGTHANILIGFTVGESVVAAFGTFTVKLPKNYFGLGITFIEMKNANEKTVIVISHVRKASPAYRSGVLNNGDELVSLNGRKMSNVDDVITYIDSIHLGEIVNVTVNKEQDVEDVSSGIVYTVELPKNNGNTIGIHVGYGKGKDSNNIFVSSLVPENVAERSGAVHVGDRILAVNDILVKNKPVEEIYEMLELSGELVKLRLQSAKCRMNNIPTIDAPATGLEIPDMSSLHRVSAWAEIFDELNQIVVGTPTGKKENGDRAAKHCGVSSNMNDSRRKNTANEGEITATQCCEVKSENDEFWEKLDELWEGMSSTHQQCVPPASQNSKTRCEPSSSRGVHDSSSCGTLTGKSISVRYVVQEKCVNPVETHERTTQQAYAYLAEDSHGNLIHNHSKILECVSEDLKPTCNAPSSIASDNETEQFCLQNPIHKLSQSSQELRGNSEEHKNLELFPAVSDGGTATASDSAQNDVLQTLTFFLKKCEEHGFGFTLKPDKFQQEVYIASILSGGPCDGMLQPLDKITKIDDQDLTQLNIYEISQILQHGPSAIQLCIVRNPFAAPDS